MALDAVSEIKSAWGYGLSPHTFRSFHFFWSLIDQVFEKKKKLSR